MPTVATCNDYVFSAAIFDPYESNASVERLVVSFFDVNTPEFAFERNTRTRRQVGVALAYVFDVLDCFSDEEPSKE